MTECINKINAVSKFTYIFAICCSYSFRYSNNYGWLLLEQFTHTSAKFSNVKWQLRQIDHIRSFAVFACRKRTSTGKPACVSSHDLYNGYQPFAVFQAETVTDDLFHRRSDIFCRTSKSRCMIRQRQVIIDSLRAAYETCRMSGNDRIIR